VETDNDPAAWYRTDQEKAQAVYSAADAATLVAVLPMLDREIETAKQALATWQASLAAGQDAVAALEEQRNEVLVALRTRAQVDPAWQELADEVGASLASALDDVAARSDASGQTLVDVAFIQAIALAQRRHLVRTELQQRALLPVFPD
jgi:hypothetical protein